MVRKRSKSLRKISDVKN